MKIYFVIGFCFLLGLVLLNPSKWKVGHLICFILILSSLPWIFRNDLKKFIAKDNIFTMRRIDQYFSEFPYMRQAYVNAIDYINSKECSNIGLMIDESTHAPEYPLFVLFQNSGTEIFRLEHINVNNVSSVKYSVHPFDEFKPCAIISITPGQKDQIYNKDDVYIKELSFGPMGVFGVR